MFKKMTTVELYTFYSNEMTEDNMPEVIAEIGKRDVTLADERELKKLGVI